MSSDALYKIQELELRFEQILPVIRELIERKEEAICDKIKAIEENVKSIQVTLKTLKERK